ncbi:uncharacterized protein [Rutidosis leptorrhynchoides]|uniref:uncharacterized protein n=1 Tax=Rutidosis leptorrhynchoides TaxID=125765 RepID=UPI003A99BC2D
MGKNSAGKSKKAPQTQSRVSRSRTIGKEETNESSDDDAISKRSHIPAEGETKDVRSDVVPETIDTQQKINKDSQEHDHVSIHGTSETDNDDDEQVPRVSCSATCSDETGGEREGNKAMENKVYESVVEGDDDIDVVIPLSSILTDLGCNLGQVYYQNYPTEASEIYNNTLYGYFLGKRVAYPVVKNYVTNVWSKYGLDKIMMNDKGFFFFHFDSEKGVKDVLENGPWIIRTMPIILNKWSPDASLTKENLSKVPVWVKLYDIPLAGFTEDGLNAIASKIGRPMMLDSYTSTICVEFWSRPNYAPAMIEVSSDVDLKEAIRVATPSLDGGNRTLDTVRVAYEWKPPRCGGCKIFGHKDAQCPHNIPIVEEKKKVDDEGFQEVSKKPSKGHGQNVHGKGKDGFYVGREKAKQVYRQVTKGKDTVGENAPKEKQTYGPSKLTSDYLYVGNSFSALDKLQGEVEVTENGADNGQEQKDESDVEFDDNDTGSFMENKKSEGASTPGKRFPMFSLASWNIRGLNRIWYWSSNSSLCQGGTRIIIGWDPDVVDIMVIAMSDQAIHCLVKARNDTQQFYVSFVYGHNYYVQRRVLWCELGMHKRFVGDRPWVVMGDFNVSLRLEESSSGASNMTIAMRDFQECVDGAGLSDVNHIAHPDFKNVVTNGWGLEIHGCRMYQVVKRLHALKKPLRKLTWLKGNLHVRVIELRAKLDAAQSDLDSNPHSVEHREVERATLSEYNSGVLEEELFLKQKSKIDWLRAGDCNSAYFHSVVRGRTHRARIQSILDENGILVEGSDVAKKFVNHFEKILGTSHDVNDLDRPGGLFRKVVSNEKAAMMIHPVTTSEVKGAIFDIGTDNLPGPDGYSSEFFKASWEIIGEDMSKVVIDFFHNG